MLGGSAHNFTMLLMYEIYVILSRLQNAKFASLAIHYLSGKFNKHLKMDYQCGQVGERGLAQRRSF
jgi:hypothetical protein